MTGAEVGVAAVAEPAGAVVVVGVEVEGVAAVGDKVDAADAVVAVAAAAGAVASGGRVAAAAAAAAVGADAAAGTVAVFAVAAAAQEAVAAAPTAEAPEVGIPTQATGTPVQATGTPVQATGTPVQATGIPVQAAGTLGSAAAAERPRWLSEPLLRRQLWPAGPRAPAPAAAQHMALLQEDYVSPQAAATAGTAETAGVLIRPKKPQTAQRAEEQQHE
jgi:hypothetical protein